jgi:hypothetical protein
MRAGQEAILPRASGQLEGCGRGRRADGGHDVVAGGRRKGFLPTHSVVLAGSHVAGGRRQGRSGRRTHTKRLKKRMGEKRFFFFESQIKMLVCSLVLRYLFCVRHF